MDKFRKLFLKTKSGSDKYAVNIVEMITKILRCYINFYDMGVAGVFVKFSKFCEKML